MHVWDVWARLEEAPNRADTLPPRSLLVHRSMWLIQ